MSEFNTLEKSDYKNEIREFLSKYIKAKLSDSDDFFALGLLNSLFAMQLVTFVESQYDISVENDDLDINNFNTINAIAAFIKKKKY